MRKATIVSVIAISLLRFAFLVCRRRTLAAAMESAPKNVPFTKTSRRSFSKSCAECHRAGEVAPFSVMSYKDARPWAKSIREKVASREMPPWHADPNHGEWLNDRRLTQAEISSIVAWVDGGALEKAIRKTPTAPKFVDGWTIGQPDETFSITEQSVPATGVIPYKYLTVPTNLKDRWITDAEIRLLSRSAVHHVIVFIQDPKNLARVDGNLLAGVAPGGAAGQIPTRLRQKIPAGARLIFQMHYTPNGEATKDVTTIGLKYAKEPPKHQVLTRPVLVPTTNPRGRGEPRGQIELRVQRGRASDQPDAAHAFARQGF